VQRNAIVVLAVVLVAFVAIGGFLIFRQTGGGGQNRTFDFVVTGNTMQPPAASAKQGDNITMSVTTDKAEEIHLHGFDLMFRGEPGKKVTKTRNSGGGWVGALQLPARFRVRPIDPCAGLGSLNTLAGPSTLSAEVSQRRFCASRRTCTSWGKRASNRWPISWSRCWMDMLTKLSNVCRRWSATCSPATYPALPPEAGAPGSA
jgi:hypothetical protein